MYIFKLFSTTEYEALMNISSTGSESDTTSRLPYDLERLIFEVAAFDWTPRHSCKLLLVAKRVHEWVRPLLNRIFVQSGRSKFPDFANHPSPRLEEVAKYAKHLTIAGYGLDDIGSTLLACTNVHDLVMRFPARPRTVLPAMRNLRLKRLSANIFDLDPERMLHPTFCNITHLEVPLIEAPPTRWDPVAKLPKLTHLLIHNGTQPDPIHYCLAHCKALRVLVFLIYFGMAPPNYLQDLAKIGDGRLVLMCCRDPREYRQIWLDGVRGGPDIWSSADLFLLARKNGFLRDSTRTHVSPDWDEELTDEGKKWFSTLCVPSKPEDPEFP